MLSEKQLTAVKALASGASNRAAGRAAGVSHVAVGKWKKDAEFQEALQSAQEAFQSAQEAFLECHPMSSVALTPEQVVAAKALANGLPVEEVALLAGVSKRTVLRWKKIDVFQAELKLARHSVAKASIEIIQESTESVFRISRDEISSMITLAFSLLKEAMSNPELAMRTRIKAAETFGSWTGLKYTQEINSAIELLERRGFKVVVEDVEHLGNDMN
ncbi:MAG: hypothetical protein F6K31_12335 [Symploca sp. SIO2G7]|nr:hypothetical protein [Symploca sp. SIO2G7]